MKKRQFVLFIILLLLMSGVTAGSLFFVRKQADSMILKESDFMEYEYHFAFITDSPGDDFWVEVYNGASEYGEDAGIYLQPFGRDLAIDFDKKELLEIAIESHVDGIILEGDESAETKKLIDQADKAGIPVVTVLSDCEKSKRKSFVGVGSYDLGREYGRQIIRVATKETGSALIIMDASSSDSGQNIIYNGIKETLQNEGNHLSLNLQIVAVNDQLPFSQEEAMRNLLLNRESIPDMIVCLSEKNTVSAYQALIDYNLVGEVAIIGYYRTEIILEAISRNIISAAISIDARQMGISSMELLKEYKETGVVSNYVIMDINTITSANIGSYITQGDKDEKN